MAVTYGTSPDKSIFPKTIGGLSLWLDANDSNTLFDSDTGGNIVTSDSASVGRWQDKSGNNRHLTQSIQTDRPLLKTLIKNKKNILRFDGSSDFLRLDSAFMYSAGSCSVFVVVALNGSAQAARRLISEGSSSSNNPIYAIMQSKIDEGDKLSPFFRNDSSTIILDQTVSYGIAFTSDFKIVTAIDSGSNYSSFINGIAGNNNNYTRSGSTFTLKRFSVVCLS